MPLLKAWHAIRASCFNTRSTTSNWATGMFREKEYPETYKTCLFDIRSFSPSIVSYRITHLVDGLQPHQEMGSWVERLLAGPDRRLKILKRDAGASCNFSPDVGSVFMPSRLLLHCEKLHFALTSTGRILNPDLSWHLRLNV